MSIIKYRFAYNYQKELIDVQTLSKEHKLATDNFKCLSCEHEMVAVLGEKRIKHFRHKVITEINCSPETYLHKIAKIKLVVGMFNSLFPYKVAANITVCTPIL